MIVILNVSWQIEQLALVTSHLDVGEVASCRELVKGQTTKIARFKVNL